MCIGLIKKIFFFVFVLCCSSYCCFTQGFTLKGTVTDSSTRYIAGIQLNVFNATVKKQVIADNKGFFQIPAISPGKYTLTARSPQHKNYEISLHITADTTINIELTPLLKQLNEVFVTAVEGKNTMTSTSVIDRKAMQLLQPSSFADLLELLPGGRSKDPALTSMNKVSLREVNNTSSNYDISALGTGFYVDGAPIITNANIQSTSGFTTTDPNGTRNTTNKGVDMRTIPTDQIEKVEIIRGIPSVEYGDISSGAIIITRKKGNTPIYARMKADGFSKLFSAGKGLQLNNNTTLNLDIDFLNALSDPRNSFTNYKRLSSSVRLEKNIATGFGTLRWAGAADWAVNVDNERTDPDNSYALTDRYISKFNRYTLKNELTATFRRNAFFKTATVLANVNFENDIIKIDKWMQARTATILVTALDSGAHDANYITPSYVGKMTVDGKPLNLFIKSNALMGFTTQAVTHQLKAGVDFSYSKNLGLGQVYDLNYPVGFSGAVQVGATTRPRAFKDVPALSIAAAYLENKSEYTIRNHRFSWATGVRAFTLPGLSSKFYLSGKVFVDPRINFSWKLPSSVLFNKPVAVTLNTGWGWLTKTPTLDYMYPPLQYVDLIQLNYYHNNPAFRKANAMTYVIDNTNYRLSAATNKKWELGTDIQYAGNRLSVTLFREVLDNGFRSQSMYRPLYYKRYINNSIDAAVLTSRPQLSDFAYDNMLEYYGYSYTTNGSRQVKRGLEYQFTSKRISSINTRITINGAWFKTTYASSLLQYGIISSSIVTANNKVRQYVGIYSEDEGTYYEQFNTNLTIDSYLPALGLNIMASIQNRWFVANQSAYKSGTPLQYMDINGNAYTYTEAHKTHPDLQWLYTNYSATNFLRYYTPIDLLANVKISKSFKKDKAVVSMFVNRLATYRPDYHNVNGALVRRSGFNTPYFGMELNFNF